MKWTLFWLLANLASASIQTKPFFIAMNAFSAGILFAIIVIDWAEGKRFFGKAEA